jgi:hypothetical protein
MSEPVKPDAVKLISSLFSPEIAIIHKTIEGLSKLFGRVDWESPELFFDRTKYYAREMGWPLHRRFVAFQNLIAPEHLVEIKLQTNNIEKSLLKQGCRQVNIDPGYISAERLVLATGKNYIHRIYLRHGIYADLTLVFKRGSFTELPWTYPDYGDPETIGYFNAIRKTYMEQLKEMRRLD